MKKNQMVQWFYGEKIFDVVILKIAKMSDSFVWLTTQNDYTFRVGITVFEKRVAKNIYKIVA